MAIHCGVRGNPSKPWGHQFVPAGVDPKWGEDNLREEFQRLAREWKKATGFSPRLERMISHPLYRQIIKLGKPVVPLILEDLERYGGYWHAALCELTGVEPIPPGQPCSLEELAAAWIKWGQENVGRSRSSNTFRGDIPPSRK